MKNKLEDLNNHLFEQLERLNDEDLKGKDLQQEINRGKAIAQISKEIISGGQLALNAQNIINEIGTGSLMIKGVLEENKTIPSLK